MFFHLNNFTWSLLWSWQTNRKRNWGISGPFFSYWYYRWEKRKTWMKSYVQLPVCTIMKTTWGCGGNRISSWWLGFQLCNLACHVMCVPLGGRDLPVLVTLKPSTYYWAWCIAGLWQCCWCQEKAPLPHKAAVEIQWANAYRMYLTQEGHLVNTNWI